VRALVLALWACGGPQDDDRPADADADADTDTDTDSDTDVDTDPDGLVVWDDVAPVFAARCAPCHVDAVRPSGGFSADHAQDLVGVVDPDSGLPYVAAGDPDGSYVWLKLTDAQGTVPGGGGARMPAEPLPAGELALVEAWILDGALSEAPTTPTDDDPLCDEALPECTGGCPAGPGSVDDAEWHARLTSSPEITWGAAPGAVRYEVSAGRAPGAPDVACWTDVGGARSHTFGALWGVVDGDVVFANVRAVHADGSVSAAVSSDGWTVDIAPPEVPAGVVDDRAPVDGLVTWTHPATDVGSGFVGYEIALGTAPFSDDALGWTAVGAAPEVVLGEDVPADGVPVGEWAWVSVRAVDVAGNASQPATSRGYVRCPDHFAFVPADDALGSTPFCVARYEMRVQGLADGNVGWSAGYVAESRPDGTPWAGVGKDQARVACDGLGFEYQLVSNTQWQALARSVEHTAANWSGGAVGAGAVPRGHSDEAPLAALSSDAGPCGGTGNAACEDPGSADWSQRRTHVLANGDVVWDLAGNLQEQVDGSTGGPDTLWTSFDSAPFTTDPGFEALREDFAPEGPYTHVHGMGRMYGGTGNLTRGGSFDPASRGSGGSLGPEDVGIYGANHNSWNTTAADGFRCVFVPM
jgi:hypothetical protein